jgi:anti-sigma B factor antagonist
VEQNRIELDRSDTGAIVVVLSGEHDVYTAPALRDQIASVIEERVPFVIEAEEQGLGFAVALGDGEAPGVRRVLEVTGLMPVFPVLSGRETALEAAKSGKPGS